MRETSDLYKRLWADKSSLHDFLVTNTETEEEYGMEELRMLRVSSALFDGDGPSVGGVMAAEADLQVDCSKEDWPRMSGFTIDFRLISADGTEESEWIRLGTFLTDTRKPDDLDETLTIHGYDGMISLQQTWIDKVNILPSAWPITAKEAVETALGVTDYELDERTELDDTVAFIGRDDKATVRETLAAAAAGCGGNWCITPEGLLRLVPLNQEFIGGSAIAGIAIAGFAVVGTDSEEPEPNHDYVVIGKDSQEFTAGAPLPPISGVLLTAANGDIAVAGDADSYQLTADCDFSSSAVASLCLDAVSGFRYQPFEASGTWIDPACELGDFLKVGSTLLPVYALDWTVGGYIVAKASAPYENEIEHEYQPRTQLQKTIQHIEKDVADLADLTDEELESLRSETESSIQQTATSIRSEVAVNYYQKNDTDTMVAGVRSQIQQAAGSLEISITNARTDANNQINEVKRYVRYEVIDGEGTVIVGQSDNPQDFRVSPTQLSACYNGEPTSFWDQNEQVTPKKLRIPEGGSLQEGSFIWQPRSSGNLSLMWVGD